MATKPIYLPVQSCLLPIASVLNKTSISKTLTHPQWLLVAEYIHNTIRFNKSNYLILKLKKEHKKHGMSIEHLSFILSPPTHRNNMNSHLLILRIKITLTIVPTYNSSHSIKEERPRSSRTPIHGSHILPQS